jgi:hypothetical protein
VRRNIGAIVATCTADTISGFGLRLVMSQLIDVSNIAMPMLEIDVAIRITVNARWPNTPAREGEGAEPLDALVKEFA